jgi:eukaryotic-like serine/threonine-protein kinase
MVAGSRVVGGRYELVEVLGTGGMATVWRATDRVLHREVAVKLLSQQFAADPGFLTRFRREAEHAAALNHPALVTVFDSGMAEDAPFIVMELVAGRTLRQVLDQAGQLTPAEAVRVAAAVCDALEAIHEAGLIHRDIKPANIVLAGASVKVLDFGIARAGGAHGETRTQAVLGTAAYLSPEQASGKPAGPRSDLYALGCVLFEMLTGEPPFSAESAVALAYRQVHDDPGPPSARCPGLQPALDQVTALLLAKDPDSRPPGAAAARTALLAAMPKDRTAVLDRSGPAGEVLDRSGPAGEPADLPAGQLATSPQRARAAAGHAAPRAWPRLRPGEALLGAALAISLLVVIVLLLTRPSGTPAALATPPPHTTSRPASSPSSRTPATHPARRGGVPASASAAGALVKDLTAFVANGQVTQQAGQQMLQQLQQLLFVPTGQDAQQTDQRYAQLIQIYDQYQARGQITGAAVGVLRTDIHALGVAVGAL